MILQSRYEVRPGKWVHMSYTNPKGISVKRLLREIKHVCQFDNGEVEIRDDASFARD